MILNRGALILKILVNSLSQKMLLAVQAQTLGLLLKTQKEGNRVQRIWQQTSTAMEQLARNQTKSRLPKKILI